MPQGTLIFSDRTYVDGLSVDKDYITTSNINQTFVILKEYYLYFRKENKTMKQISSKLGKYPEWNKRRLCLEQTRPIISPIRPSFTSSRRKMIPFNSTIMMFMIIQLMLGKLF